MSVLKSIGPPRLKIISGYVDFKDKNRTLTRGG